MKFTAFLPMKLNSERVKDKNFTLINKKPLFFYILDTLQSVKHIDQILIDVDSEVVIDKVKEYFDNVDFKLREDNLLDPSESVNKIIESNFHQIKNNFIFQTHTTNPLLTTNTINEALELYMENKNSLFSVNSFQSRFYDQSLNPINHNPNELIPTQNLDFIYEENSNFYIFSKEDFIENGNKRIGNKSVHYITKKYESVDLDTEEDLELLRRILE